MGYKYGGEKGFELSNSFFGFKSPEWIPVENMLYDFSFLLTLEITSELRLPQV